MHPPQDTIFRVRGCVGVLQRAAHSVAGLLELRSQSSDLLFLLIHVRRRSLLRGHTFEQLGFELLHQFLFRRRRRFRIFSRAARRLAGSLQLGSQRGDPLTLRDESLFHLGDISARARQLSVHIHRLTLRVGKLEFHRRELGFELGHSELKFLLRIDALFGFAFERRAKRVFRCRAFGTLAVESIAKSLLCLFALSLLAAHGLTKRTFFLRALLAFPLQLRAKGSLDFVPARPLALDLGVETRLNRGLLLFGATKQRSKLVFGG